MRHAQPGISEPIPAFGRYLLFSMQAPSKAKAALANLAQLADGLTLDELGVQGGDREVLEERQERR